MFQVQDSSDGRSNHMKVGSRKDRLRTLSVAIATINSRSHTDLKGAPSQYFELFWQVQNYLENNIKEQG